MESEFGSVVGDWIVFDGELVFPVYTPGTLLSDQSAWSGLRKGARVRFTLLPLSPQLRASYLQRVASFSEGG